MKSAKGELLGDGGSNVRLVVSFFRPQECPDLKLGKTVWPLGVQTGRFGFPELGEGYFP